MLFLSTPSIIFLNACLLINESAQEILRMASIEMNKCLKKEFDALREEVALASAWRSTRKGNIFLYIICFSMVSSTVIFNIDWYLLQGVCKGGVFSSTVPTFKWMIVNLLVSKSFFDAYLWMIFYWNFIMQLIVLIFSQFHDYC